MPTEPAPAESETPATSDDPPEGAAPDGESPQAATESPERIIYIPFGKLDDVLDRPDANILLPRDDYQKLVDFWKKSQRPTASEIAFTRAAYTLQVEGEIARIQAELTVHVAPGKGGLLPAVFGSAAIAHVHAPEGVYLRGLGAGEYEFLFLQPGEHRIELQLSSKVSAVGDGRSTVLEIPPAAMATLHVSVPDANQEVAVSPGVASTEASASEQQSSLTAEIGAANRVTISWRPKRGEQPEQETLTSVENRTLVNVEGQIVHTQAWLEYEVLRGALKTVKIAVPPTHRILDIESTARLENWSVASDGKEQVATVQFQQDVKDRATVEIRTEQRLEGARFSAGGRSRDGATLGVHAIDVARERGQIVIREGAGVSVTVGEQLGLLRVPATELDPRLQGKGGLAFRFFSQEMVLQLDVKAVEPRLIAAQNVEFFFGAQDLQIQSTLNFSINRAGVFELRVRIPELVLLDDVRCAAMQDYQFDETSRVLTISLREQTSGAVPVTVTGRRPLPQSGNELLELPLLDAMNVERESGTVRVYVGESIELVTDQEKLQGAQPQAGATGAAKPGARLASAWTYSRRPVVIAVRASRKPARLSARVGTTIDVQPELVSVRSRLTYQVDYSGLDTFRFDIPEGVSGAVRIESVSDEFASAPIKQRSASEPADGRVVWTVVTQGDVVGRQSFLVSYDLPAPSSSGAGDAGGALAVEAPRPLGVVNASGEAVVPLTRLQGEIAIRKDSALTVDATATGAGMERIDVRELELLPSEGTIAFRYFQQAADQAPGVSVTSRRFEIQPSISTVISRGLVEVALGADQAATYRCRYRIQTAERQRLLVLLPVKLEILGAFINEREVKLEKAGADAAPDIDEQWAPYWLNVARPESSDTPFLLSLQFLWNINPSLGESQFHRGRLELPLPLIGGSDSVVQELRAAIWLPEEYRLVGEPEGFELRQHRKRLLLLGAAPADRRTGDLENWITQGSSAPMSLQFPTEGRLAHVYSNLGGAKVMNVAWWNVFVMTLILSGAVAAMGWVLVRTSWENKLTILLLAAFGAALYGIQDSAGLYEAFYAARFGILTLLGLWLIHGVFAWLKPDEPPPPRRYESKDIRYAVIPPPGVFDSFSSGSDSKS